MGYQSYTIKSLTRIVSMVSPTEVLAVPTTLTKSIELIWIIYTVSFVDE
jgi:hypothetical protein